jgi:hypothetical protein
VAVVAVPAVAAGEPLFRAALAWEADAPAGPATFSLEVLDGQWPAGLLALVDLTPSAGLTLPPDPWCGVVPPALAPAEVDFAFCPSNLIEAFQDTLAVIGEPTMATLHLGSATSAFDVYARLSRPGAISFDYPIPEPATLTLLGAGLFAVGAALRKRRPRIT